MGHNAKSPGSWGPSTAAAPPLETRRRGFGRVPRGSPRRLGQPGLLGPRRAPPGAIWEIFFVEICLISRYASPEIFESLIEIYLAEMHLLTMVFVENQIKNSLWMDVHPPKFSFVLPHPRHVVPPKVAGNPLCKLLLQTFLDGLHVWHG